MSKELKYDYDGDLDILHVYNSEISNGIKGGITYGSFNIDIGYDDKVVGIELEGASTLLNMPENTLSNLDSVNMITRKVGNILFIGFTVIKGKQTSTLQVNVPMNSMPTMMSK